MLGNVIDNINRSKAAFAREVEYVKETHYDDELDMLLEKVETRYETETPEELVEAVEMLKQLSDEEDPMLESAAIDRILNAETDLTFEEMEAI